MKNKTHILMLRVDSTKVYDCLLISEWLAVGYDHKVDSDVFEKIVECVEKDVDAPIFVGSINEVLNFKSKIRKYKLDLYIIPHYENYEVKSP